MGNSPFEMTIQDQKGGVYSALLVSWVRYDHIIFMVSMWIELPVTVPVAAM